MFETPFGPVDMTGLESQRRGGVPRRWGDFGVRAASGVVLVVAAIGTARIGGNLFILLWLAASIAVLWEWQRLIGGAELRSRVGVGAVALAVVAVVAHRELSSFPGLTHISLGPLCILLAVAAVAQAALAGAGRRVWAATGMGYAGTLILAVLALRFSFPYGIRSIVWLFAVVWSTDVSAYIGGRLIGGPKLWLRISPSKTWSGAVVGTCAGAAIGTFVAVRDLPQPFEIAPIFLLSLVTSLVSQCGDAAESGMKRHFHVKDSSRLIPGHGGVMDRLDGFIFAAAFAFAFGYFRDLGSIALGLLYWA
jgi:phosphatidate cytidylyltransferase